jgi:photosystem II stability/assembly factor-like uncharacterized protein
MNAAMYILKSPAHAARAVLSLLFLLVLPAVAGAAGWKALGPDRMGIRGPSCLAFDPARPSRAFAGLSGGGIARSLDGGETWQMVSRGLTGSSVSAIAVHPANGQWIYAIAERTLHRSTDGGQTWVPLRSPVDAVQLDPQRPAVVWAGGPAGLFRSGDGGVTWKRRGNLPAGNPVLALSIDPRDPLRIYASLAGSAGFGLWVSEDGGHSWERRRRRLSFQLYADPHAAGSVIAYGGTSILERSRDAGRTWELFFAAEPIHGPFSYPVALAADPRQAGKFFVLVDSSDPIPGLYATTDGGKHWQASAAGMPLLWTPSALAVGRGGALLVGGKFETEEGAIYRSTDAGAHWQPAIRGLANAEVSAFAVSRRGTLFAAGYPFGIAYSLDNGSSWTAVPLATADPLTSEPIISKLVPDPTDPDILYAVNTYPFAFGPEPHRVWKTTDGGVSWRPLPYPLTGPGAETQLTVLDLAVDPSDPSTLFLASEGDNVEDPSWQGVFRSRDGGETWENVVPGFFEGLAVHPGAPGRIFALSSSGLYRSTDHGDHWDKVFPPDGDHLLRWMAVAPSDPNIVYVLKESAMLFRSDDGGVTWQSLGRRFDASVVAVDPLDADTFVFGDQGFVVRLTLGQGRHPLNDGLANRRPTALLFDPNDPLRLLAATAGAGVMEYKFPAPEPRVGARKNGVLRGAVAAPR